MPARDAPGAGPGALTVGRVPVADTYPLRRAVLRPGRPLSSVHLAADADPATAAIAARTADGEVVGAAVVMREPCQWMPDRPGAWRLRGMATAEGRRGAGVGARVLQAAVDYVAAARGSLVWCNARVPARRFYERAGFAAHGEEWVDPDIGPHIAMWRPLP
jgi:predicted GNAT family N-acyltransferase